MPTRPFVSQPFDASPYRTLRAIVTVIVLVVKTVTLTP
jgi:hypothetical protein